jgi:hypothetical protein
MVTSTCWVGTTLPSGTARMRSGSRPPCTATMRRQPDSLKGSPWAANTSRASSTSAWVTGVSSDCLMIACRPKNSVRSYTPPRDST